MASKPDSRKAAVRLHDRVNLLILPLIGCMAVAGLLPKDSMFHYDPVKVTNAFLMYIVADAVWIMRQPECLPSLPTIVLAHHAITLVLLLFPVRFPEYATFTCWDGLVELNTFMLIARRQLSGWPRLRKTFNRLYWATFFPLRFMLCPYLIFHFWFMLAHLPAYERLNVAACQIGLFWFNGLMLWASVKRRWYSGELGKCWQFCTGEIESWSAPIKWAVFDIQADASHKTA